MPPAPSMVAPSTVAPSTVAPSTVPPSIVPPPTASPSTVVPSPLTCAFALCPDWRDRILRWNWTHHRQRCLFHNWCFRL